jgi:lipoyl-dependent peroxiredoxin
MAVRTSEAIWKGTLREGSGKMKLGSGAFEGAYTYVSRFEEGPGTNPEELIGAANAGCFSMFLASLLTKAGFSPTRIHTSASVHLESGSITKIDLNTEAAVPEVEETAFQEYATEAKEKCPVSKALAAVEINLSARLVK